MVQRTHELQKQQLLHAAASERESNLQEVLSKELAHYKRLMAEEQAAC